MAQDTDEACHACGNTNTTEVWHTRGWPYGKNRIVACVRGGCGSKSSAPCPPEEEKHLPVLTTIREVVHWREQGNAPTSLHDIEGDGDGWSEDGDLEQGVQDMIDGR